MYINSTSLYINLSGNASNIPASLITSERYYNCEDFFKSTNHNRKKLFQRNRQSK
jgi:hypothetical protein